MQGGNQCPKIIQQNQRRELVTKETSGAINPHMSSGQAPKVIVAGNTNPSGNGMNGQVFDAEGLAPTLTTNKGEGSKILIDVNQHKVKLTKKSLCLDANYFKGLEANQMRTGVMELAPGVMMPESIARTVRSSGRSSYDGKHTHDLVAIQNEEPRAVLTLERLEKRQNGRRMKEPGEPMFTLTVADVHGIAILSDMEAEKSTTRRGTFKEEYVGTLDRDCNVAVTVEDKRHSILDTKNGTFGKVNEYLERCPTILASDYKEQKLVRELTGQYRIRKLTVLECFRLQSYPDMWYVILKLFRHPEYIERVDMTRNDITAQVLKLIQDNGLKEGMSDSQLYKMVGNGVTSDVAEDIGRRLL
jgi:hypothetical protein